MTAHRLRPRAFTAIVLTITAGFGLGVGLARADVGAPQRIDAPSVSPVDVAGASPRVHQGDRLHQGQVLIRRVVALNGGENRQELTFTCPAGTTLEGLGFAEGRGLAMQVV